MANKTMTFGSTSSGVDIDIKNGGIGTSTNTYILFPEGGGYRQRTNSTGYLKITLPQSWTNTMMSFKIQIYEYDTAASCEYVVGGYNHTSESWLKTFAYSNSKNNVQTHSNLTVRFGHDGTTCAIYIGESNTSWNYPQIQIHDVLVSFTNYEESKWINGWSVSFTTDLGTITSTITNPNTSYYSVTSGTATEAKKVMGALTSNGTTATTDKGKSYGVAGVTSGNRIFSKWYVNIDSGITTLEDGLIIEMRIPIAGCSSGCAITIDNGTSFHPVVFANSSILTTHFGNGVKLLLMYDSTGVGSVYGTVNGSTATAAANITGVWRVMNCYYSDSNTYTSAYCTTGASDAKKTAYCSDYALLSNSYLHFIIKTSNTKNTALTMNVNGKGAKPIYINGTVSSSTNYTLNAGSYIAYYDGINYYFNTEGKIPGSIEGNAETATALTTSAGTATQPVYFSGGKPVAGTYSLNKTVPSDAVFTDTWNANSKTEAGYVAAPGAVANKVWKTDANGNPAWRDDDNTTYDAVSKTAAGLCPQLPNETTTTKYLRQDGIWVVPPNDNTTYSSKAAASGGTDVSLVTTGEKYAWNNKSSLVIGTTATTAAAGSHTHSNMTAATASAAGAAGFVPAPAAGKQTSFLRGDGTWAVPTNTTYNAATTSAQGLMSAADKTKLDGIETKANNYSHPTDSGNKHIPSGGSSGQILRWSADGTAVWGNDNNTTYSAEKGITLSSGKFGHSNTAITGASVGLSANASPAHGETFNVPYLTYDNYGHITAASTQTVTLPDISGDDLFKLYTYTKSITLTQVWQDTGIEKGSIDDSGGTTSLDSGTYIIQMYINSTATGTVKHYKEYYSGIMSWFKDSTNSSNYDEIVLHKAGLAPNNNSVYLRTIRTATGDGGKLKLQISANIDTTVAAQIIFKFRKMI